jgi:hypothetical protein
MEDGCAAATEGIAGIIRWNAEAMRDEARAITDRPHHRVFQRSVTKRFARARKVYYYGAALGGRPSTRNRHIVQEEEGRPRLYRPYGR